MAQGIAWETAITLAVAPSGSLDPAWGLLWDEIADAPDPVGTPRAERTTIMARTADTAADRIAGELGAGVLVSIGGQLSARGPAPEDGWTVAVLENRVSGDETGECTLHGGGLVSIHAFDNPTTSGGRGTHSRGPEPRAIHPSRPWWEWITVASTSCLDACLVANEAFSWGDDGPDRLDALEIPARLVRWNGEIVTTGAWTRRSGELVVVAGRSPSLCG
jgi:thiamine biosynthesis lipoprotein